MRIMTSLQYAQKPAQRSSMLKNMSVIRRSKWDSYTSSSSTTSSSSDEETNAKDLKPIKEYLADRRDLASQLFKSVKAEKIRMMLPQILKKIDLNDLEELCAAELIGMSKKRIMSIIDDQAMLESSDTDESDNSGPSLEIISDTEWISEGSTSVKIEGTKSKNKNTKKVKKKPQDAKDKPALKSKVKGKAETESKSNVKIKTEKIKTEGKPKEKPKEKDKECGNLLDLLELEMRARAIRALIRKEEDSTSQKNTNPKSSSSTATETGTSNDQTSQARQANLKEQLEKIDVLMKHGDDEDVFVVIHPAPTIELLSSDSENEDPSKRVNKKLVSERQSESENVKEKVQSNDNKIQDKITEKNTSQEKDKSNEENILKEKNENIKNKKIDCQKESPNLPISVIESSSDDKQENPQDDLEEGEIVDDGDDNNKVTNDLEKESTVDMTLKKKIKKVKKNPHVRSRKKHNENSDEDLAIQTLESKVVNSKIEKSIIKKSEPSSSTAEGPIEIEESPTRENEKEKDTSSKEKTIEDKKKMDDLDNKALDIEEIINLDDYPDDTDETENDKSTNVETKSNDTTNANTQDTDTNCGLPRSETWATRYFKQDDVQSVIKESKIQSEIRKRLRERQRQSKLSNSPILNDQETSEPIPEDAILKPTGSVEEYLALKALSSGNNSNISGTNSNTSGDKADSPNLQYTVQVESLSNNNSMTGQEFPFASVNKSVEIAEEVQYKEKSDFKKSEVVKQKLSSNELNKIESLNQSTKNENKICSEKSEENNKKLIVIEENVEVNDIRLPSEEKSKPDKKSEQVEFNTSCKQKDLVLDENDTSIEKIKQVDLDSSNDQTKNISPSKDDSIRSDSSEDNITVKIDNVYASNVKPMQLSNQENVEQTKQIILSDQKINETPPD